jgi:hypothetical protein
MEWKATLFTLRNERHSLFLEGMTIPMAEWARMNIPKTQLKFLCEKILAKQELIPKV